MDPKKDQTAPEITPPSFGPTIVPPSIKGEREISSVQTELAKVEKGQNLSGYVQVNDDFEDQSRQIIPPPPVNIQIQEPKPQSSAINDRELKREAKGSPSSPTTWKAVITIFEGGKNLLRDVLPST